MKRVHAHRESSHASLALVVPVAGFGGLMLALGIATGKASAAVKALPLPEPGLNSWPLVCVAVLVGGCWLGLRRVETPAHPQLELPRQEKWPRRREPLDDCAWPDAGSELFGTYPFAEAPQPRRLHPAIPAEDLAIDPEQLNPTLLPVRAEKRVVRS